MNIERIKNLENLDVIFQENDTQEELEWYFLYYLFTTISTLTTTFYLKNTNFTQEEIDYFLKTKKEIIKLIAKFFNENKKRWHIITNHNIFKEIAFVQSIIKQYDILIFNN